MAEIVPGGAPTTKIMDIKVEIPGDLDPGGVLIVVLDKTDPRGRTHTVLPFDKGYLNLHMAQAALAMAAQQTKAQAAAADRDQSGLVLPNGRPHLTLH